jgi:hypothetical protein
MPRAERSRLWRQCARVEEGRICSPCQIAERREEAKNYSNRVGVAALPRHVAQLADPLERDPGQPLASCYRWRLPGERSMNTTAIEYEATIDHEAGHGAAATVLGYPPTAIEVNANGTGNCQIPLEINRATARDFLLILLAGRIAEAEPGWPPAWPPLRPGLRAPFEQRS